MPKAYAATVALLLALIAGCSGAGGGNADPEPAAGSRSTEIRTAEPRTALLDWAPVQVEETALDGTVIDAGEWTLTVPGAGDVVHVSGAREQAIPAGPDRRVDAVLVPRPGTAVVAAADRLEERPTAITVVDLATGASTPVTTPQPAPFGEVVAFTDGIRYATLDRGRFCLATTPLDGPGEVTWCAPQRQGWNHVLPTRDGVALQTFDDRRPIACRTLVTLDEGEVTPVSGVPACSGWNVARTADGTIWSTIPHERRIELGAFHARAGDTTYDLGTGNTDSLLACGDSLWFTRDAGGGRPAQLLRWTPDAELEVAYQGAAGGEGFLTVQCAADRWLTVTSQAEGGDEVVSATVPG